MGGVVLKGRFPRRRIVVVVVQNAFRYLLKGAARNWIRNLGTIAPALGSMTLLLLLTGLVGLTGFALRNLAAIEARDASLLHVYLKDDALTADVSGLQAKLSADRRVVSVAYVSKDEALRRAERRPGLPDLASASDTNPFPASLDVQIRSVSDVGGIDALVRNEIPVDPGFPDSYDKGAYQVLQQILMGVGIAGGVFLLLLGFVAVTVTANSIRAAILTRKDELTIMQLVGAPRWMVRGPFLIEGAMTGGIAGAVAGLVTVGASLLAIEAGASSFSQVAPGVTVSVAVVAGLLILLAGLLLGSGSSLISLRRHLKA